MVKYWLTTLASAINDLSLNKLVGHASLLCIAGVAVFRTRQGEKGIQLPQ